MRAVLPLVTVALVLGMAKAAMAAGAYLTRDHRDRATRITTSLTRQTRRTTMADPRPSLDEMLGIHAPTNLDGEPHKLAQNGAPRLIPPDTSGHWDRPAPPTGSFIFVLRRDDFATGLWRVERRFSPANAQRWWDNHPEDRDAMYWIDGQQAPGLGSPLNPYHDVHPYQRHPRNLTFVKENHHHG